MIAKPMINASYPLQTLLELREQICRRRQQELVAVEEALAFAEREVEKARHRLQRGQETLHVRQDQVFSIGVRSLEQYKNERFFLERLSREIKALKNNLLSAEEERNRLLASREIASQEKKKAETELEVVKRNQRSWTLTRRQKEQQKAEQEFDELNTARFILNRH